MLHFYHTELAQLGRALGLGPRGREFESRIPYYEGARNKHIKTDHFLYVSNALAEVLSLSG